MFLLSLRGRLLFPSLVANAPDTRKWRNGENKQKYGGDHAGHGFVER